MSSVNSLKSTIQEAMKAAMRAKEKPRLGTIRLILAAVKQREVDERIELDDTQLLAVLDKMVKQRRDSITQYEAADRPELAEIERQEIMVLQEYLPSQLGEDEIAELVEKAINDSGASGPQGMGQVMGLLKPQVQGRADMGAVSQLVKRRLIPS